MRRVLFAIFVLLSAVEVIAQAPMVFNRISVEDAMGLASNQVNCLLQDKKGFIWVGTANGLQRFDGTKFIKLADGRNPLPIAELHNILEDREGRLWLSFSQKREFGYFNPSDFSFQRVPIKIKEELPSRTEFRLWMDSKGEIFLNVTRFKVLHYNKEAKAFLDDAEYQLPAGWKPGIRFFEDTISRRLYMLSFDSGLAVYDHRTKEVWTRYNNPKRIPLLSEWKYQQGITNYFIDSKRRHWIIHWPVWGGGGEYKHCFDSLGRSLPDTAGLFRTDVGYSEFHGIAETRQGKIWIYGLNILFSSNSLTGKFDFHRSQIEHNFLVQYDVVHDVLEDKDGSIWIATDKGLFFTGAGTDRYVGNILFDESTANSFINDILQLKNGDYWLADWGKGFIVLDRNFKRKSERLYRDPIPAAWPQATKNAVRQSWALHQESHTGKIWAGFNGGIIAVHDPVSGRTQWTIPEVFSQRTIRTITEDSKGRLWFGTQGGRVVCYDSGKYRVVQDFRTIINKVFIDKQDMVWVAATEKGLFALDGNSGEVLQQYHKDDPANPTFMNTASDVEQLNDSIIVYGAGALNFINKRTGKVTIYSFRDGLPSNTTTRLRMDKKGYLWVMTTSGLCRYNQANNKITPFGRKDGIMFTDLARSCDYVSNNGLVMFGGENALMYFDPEHLKPERKGHDVMITDVKLFNDYLPIDSLLGRNKAHFDHDRNTITIYFSALSYLMNDKLNYYYQLEGADKGWIRAERNNYVSYNQLGPGQYVFKVYCENSEGLRSPEITSFSFHIRPPFWQTPWFILLAISLVGGLIYLIHRLRINRLIAVQKLRLRVARDLHDDMGSTLSTINILSSMAKSKINSDTPKATEYISKISDNSQRMMEAMDDIVWSIKPSNDSMEKITSRMRELATSVLEAKEIDLHFKVEKGVNDVKLNMEARRDFFLVYKEAINNAAKYSKASAVDVFITSHQKKLLLMVKDNGAGFDPDAAGGKGNGLGNMQKRADAMNARLQLKSSPGQGTKILLTVPLT